MTTLTWTKKRAGGWVLKASDGQIWAVVAPYRSEFACKNQFRATVLNSNCAGHNGKRYWTTGIGIKAAKRNIEFWLSRQSYDSFMVAAS